VEERFDGFGTSVIFAEDLNNPACDLIRDLSVHIHRI
jgi:hypothetical protein